MKFIYLTLFVFTFLITSLNSSAQSCNGNCGGFTATCACDNDCWLWLDCCPDVCAYCPGTNTAVCQPGPYVGCNIQASVCTAGTAGPFTFDYAVNEIDFAQGCLNTEPGYNNYGFILLNITSTGFLNLLINADGTGGYLDVIIYDIPQGEDPCTAAQNAGNIISCSWAQTNGGCNQIGTTFPCGSSVAAPFVNAGDQVLIIVQDWGEFNWGASGNSSFTLTMSSTPGSAGSGPLDATIDPVGPFCVSDGNITLNPATGGGTWSGTGVDPNTGVFSPSSAGAGSHVITYNVGVAPCDGTDQITIVVDPAIGNPVFDSPFTSVRCQGPGSDNYSATATNSTSISYSISPGGAGTIDPNTGTVTWSPGFSGNATITATAQGCNGPTSSNINVQVNPTPTPTIFGDNSYCQGNTAAVSTQAFPNYSWSNGANTQNTNVTAANNPITVTVTDANGCSGTSPAFNVVENPNPTPTITGDTEYCQGNTAAVSTQAFPNYSWSNGANTQNTNVTAANNPITVTVTDANGCSGTSPAYNVTENPVPTPTITGDTEYCQGNTAAVSTQAFPNYSWSNGATTQNTNVTAANNPITVTVTDANGCSGTSPAYNVVENPNPTPTITGDTEYCQGNTAAVSTQAFANYSWSNGATSQNTNVTTADNAITVTVTDANGCSGTSPALNVTENPNPQIALSPTDPSVCNGTDGEITVNSVSGSNSGDMSWTGTATGSVSSIGLSYTLTGLSSGNYNITFTDENGCISNTESVVLSNPNAPNLNAISDTSSCEVDFVVPDPSTYITGTDLTGNQAFYSATGGDPSDELPQGTVITSAMSPMTIYVYDNSGTCDSEVSFIVYVNENPTATITPNPIELCEGNSVNLSGNPAGGSGTYSSHEWTGDVSILNATNIPNPSTLTSATIGTYNLSYTVTDNNGCSGSDNVTVTINEVPILSGIQEICEDEVTSLSSTGTPDLSTPWTSSDPSVVSVDNNGEITGISGGTATITFLDANGCSASIVITINPKPVITLAPTDPSTCNGTDGFITVNGSGTGIVNWSGDASGSEGSASLPYDITDLAAGNFNVTFTDAVTGCESDQVSTSINNPGAPIIDPISDTSSCEIDFEIPDPSTFISGTNLTGNQAFYSAPGGNAVDELTQGTLITNAMSPMVVYVFDNNGVCESQTSFTVYVNENPIVNISPNPISVCSGEDISINGNPSGGSGNFVDHNWTNTGSPYLDDQNIQTPIFNSNDIGSYDLTYTVEDDNGCSASETVSVEVLQSTEIDPIGPLTACGELVLPNITGNNLSGSESYYDDTQANNGQEVTGVITSSTNLYIYDTGADCSNEILVEITIDEIPEITSPLNDLEYCDYEIPDDIIISVSGESDWELEYSFNGNPLTLTSSQNEFNLGNDPGTYVITLLSDNNCSNNSSETFELIIKPSPDAPIVSGDAEFCSTEELDSMRAEGSGGTITWYINELFEEIFGTGEFMVPENLVGTTTYYVTETLDGCESEAAEIIIAIIDCDIILSTAITPDGDGLNDYWIIPNLDEAYPNNLVRIYNRWGGLIFEHDSSKSGSYNDNPWDGTHNGKELPVGSYFFVIDFNNEAGENISGSVSIIID